MNSELKAVIEHVKSVGNLEALLAPLHGGSTTLKTDKQKRVDFIAERLKVKEQLKRANFWKQFISYSVVFVCVGLGLALCGFEGIDCGEFFPRAISSVLGASALLLVGYLIRPWKRTEDINDFLLSLASLGDEDFERVLMSLIDSLAKEYLDDLKP